MKKIGIKLADGTFFPILEEGSTGKKEINLTTVKDNQTKVKVALYRSEKSSIDEAEYLDTLEISKMKKHPNGEPNIGLEISLDEKNELSAKIVDKESGVESQVSLSLLSDNKNVPKNFDAENSDEAEGVTLASAPETAEEIPFEKGIEENAPETAEPTEENIADVLPSLDELDLSLPETFGEDDAPPIKEAALQNDDFSSDENISDEPQGEESLSDETATDLDLSDLDFSPSDEKLPEEAAQDSANDDLNFPDLDLPDLDFSQDNSGNTNIEESVEANSQESAEKVAQDSALPDLDLPDISFDDSDFAAMKNEIQDEPESANDDLDFSDMDFEMPNFDDTDSSSNRMDLNFDDEKKSLAENSFDSFSGNNSSAGALDFSDLYDNENDYGENSQDKNQKFPVVVCIVCAIICVLALLAILFVAPMRLDSFGKNQSQDSAQELPQDFPSEQTVSELPPPPEPVAPIAPPAKEDEIVVITETKNVVPDFPAPQEKKSAPKEIVYKIKWGDTLWDLSATYYKNPWLYPKIARYNNIKNPDYIIAGSTIRIPEE